jgi:hypothetical protein
MALVAAYDLECEHLDVITAFLNGKLDRKNIYIQLPEGYRQYQKDGVALVGLLLKALYGLKQAPRLWYEELKSFLITLKYIPIPANLYIFVSQQSGQIIIAYVDNLILIRQNIRTIKLLKEVLRNKYKVRDLGLITYYLGI